MMTSTEDTVAAIITVVVSFDTSAITVYLRYPTVECTFPIET